MSDYLIKGETLTDIANAIRGKTGSTSPIRTQDFATEIEGIQAGGGGGDIDGLIDGTLTEVTSNATSIRERVFYNYSTLLTANFPNATAIGQYAFYGNTALKNIDFANVTTIGQYAFQNCDALRIANFPNATSIGNYAFGNCRALTTVDFPLVTTIDNYAFNTCIALTTANFPNATSIGTSVFSGCSALTTVDFPLATSIGTNAFYGCRALTTANIPNATSMDRAFYSCIALTTANIANATSIGNNAFYDCRSLTKLIIGTKQSSVCTLASTSVFTNCYHILGIVNATYNPNGDKDGYIYVPNSLVANYRTATNWVTYATQIMPWVATREELDSIDNTLYDHACVGEVEYIYDGDSWRIFR